MSGPIHTDPNLPDEERDRIFMEKLRNLPNDELANAIEGHFFAPNPHYVNEAARRLKIYGEKMPKLVECLNEALRKFCNLSTPCQKCPYGSDKCEVSKWRKTIEELSTNKEEGRGL